MADDRWERRGRARLSCNMDMHNSGHFDQSIPWLPGSHEYIASVTTLQKYS